MALTINQLPSPTIKGPIRGQKFRVAIITPDASKPTAGYVVSASAFNMSSIDAVILSPAAGSAYAPSIRIATDSSSMTLQFYNAVGVASDIGTAVSASVAALSTNLVTALFIGR